MSQRDSGQVARSGAASSCGYSQAASQFRRSREALTGLGLIRAGRLLGRMPALVALHDLALRLERRHDPVQVVRLDLHRSRHLGDGDSRPGTDHLERLLGAVAAAAGATPPAGSSRAATAAPGGGGGAPAISNSRQGGRRLLQPVVLVNQRAKLAQPCVYLFPLLIQKISHWFNSLMCFRLGLRAETPRSAVRSAGGRSTCS